MKHLFLYPQTLWQWGFKFTSASLLGLISVGASSQSLFEMVQSARQYDATYLSSKALSESGPFKAAQARALNRLNAGLNASLGATRAQNAPGAQNGSTHSVTLQAQQPLFNLAHRATIELAQKQLEISQLDLTAAEQDLIIRVAQGYFDVLAAQDALSTANASKTAITEQLASARRNFEVGTATITDSREAQARFDLSRAVEIAAENDLRIKRLALDQLVGQANATPYDLAQPAVLPVLTPSALDEWLSLALASRPELKRARVALESAQLQTRKAQSGHYPTFDAVARHIKSGGEVNRNSNTTSLGLEMNLPLFQGFSVQNQVRESLILEEKAQHDFEAVQRAVEQGTRVAYFGNQSGLAQVQALEAAEKSTQLALEATQLGYSVGVRVNLDVLNAQTQLFTTRRDLAKARYDVILSGLRLKQATGQLNSTDVQATDQLLKKP
jgi:outer membrane protein